MEGNSGSWEAAPASAWCGIIGRDNDAHPNLLDSQGWYVVVGVLHLQLHGLEGVICCMVIKSLCKEVLLVEDIDAHLNPHISKRWYGGDTCGKIDGGYMQYNHGWGNVAPAAAWFGGREMWHGDYYNMYGIVSGGGNDAHQNFYASQRWYGGDTCKKGGDYHSIYEVVSGGGNDAHPNTHVSQGWYGGASDDVVDGRNVNGKRVKYRVVITTECMEVLLVEAMIPTLTPMLAKDGNSGCEEVAAAAALFGGNEMWHGDYHSMYKGASGGDNNSKPIYVSQGWYGGAS
eukprot:15343729-Ditylum_brightwellii.AAC.1